jgi:hypothetical protein
MPSITLTIPKPSDVQGAALVKQGNVLAAKLLATMQALGAPSGVVVPFSYATLVETAPLWASSQQGDLYSILRDAFQNQGWVMDSPTVDSLPEITLLAP